MSEVTTAAMQTNDVLSDAGGNTPLSTLEYVEYWGKQIHELALVVQAMCALAESGGISVDLTGTNFGAFELGGARATDLMKIRMELIMVASAIFEQGVEVTDEEVDRQLKKMGKRATISHIEQPG